MLCLAITCVLLLAIFVYVRQVLNSVETRISVLSAAVQAMADITRMNIPVIDHESENESVNDETRSEESDEYESDVKHVSVSDEPTVELVNVSDDESVHSEQIIENEIVVKKIDLVLPFDAWSVKELKEQVAKLNGPKLKTKKELVDFLEKKNIQVEV